MSLFFEVHRDMLRHKYQGDAIALAEFDECTVEIDMYRKYSREYGYEFYVMQLPQD